MQLIIEPKHSRLQSLLVSTPTFVGTKDFLVNRAPGKCSFSGVCNASWDL